MKLKDSIATLDSKIKDLEGKGSWETWIVDPKMYLVA